MFSVIIPSYNKSSYIANAIHSVVNQSFQDLELIIIDDGSTDNSLEKLRETSNELQENNPVSFSKLKIIEQINQGVSTTRNIGVKLAKYEYIAFLDADDWWEPTFLEEMKQLVEEFPEAGIYGSSYFIVKNYQKRIAPIGLPSNFIKGSIDYFKTYSENLCMPLTSISVVIPKQIFVNEHGFKPNLKFGEDFDLWVRIASQKQVVFLNKPLSNYNQDVDLKNRAVGCKFYQPSENMIFTDYGDLMKRKDFRILFEKLILNGIYTYYIFNKNTSETQKLLSTINWKNHHHSVKIKFKIIPKLFLRFHYYIVKKISTFKQMIILKVNR